EQAGPKTNNATAPVQRSNEDDITRPSSAASPTVHHALQPTRKIPPLSATAGQSRHCRNRAPQ
ncbi:MAG TPA: hypothetical protein P5057_03775, partial [Acidobacteriota bacterium]|nr:hypothetical protein [Acidobacteriota bacterium]